MNTLWFFIVILLANVVQGITGFAGTILAMPPSLLLVGYPVAKPVLNVLGLLSGIYVFAGNRKQVQYRELKKVVALMVPCVAAGIGIKFLLQGQEKILYVALGCFVILLAVFGLAGMKKKKESRQGPGDYALLAGAGIAHGMFVSGGPLLIGYLTKRVKEKSAFRATISTVWIILNTIILFSDIYSGLWTWELLKILVCSLPFLFGGMWIGGKLYRIMSQQLFMVLTYILLFISGITLLLK